MAAIHKPSFWGTLHPASEVKGWMNEWITGARADRVSRASTERERDRERAERDGEGD